MRHFQSNSSPVLLFVLALACFLFTGGLYAGEPIKVAGKMIINLAREDSVTILDTDGHLLSFQIYEGTNASTGENDFMSGAMARNISFSDMVMGNGINQGYCEFTLDNDATVAKWTGKVITTLKADSTFVTSFEGKFTFIGGIGKFEKISGGGTFSGGPTAETTTSIDWQAEYTLEE
ncbi:MAG: hypothetical protein GY841_05700 [FCB group bacterium]|nr:hypothetical protein [FCB group bacterium]